MFIEDNIKFSVIYSFDVHKDEIKSYIDGLLPPKHQRQEKLWDVTENEAEDECNIHRKFCAILNWKQFVDFVDWCDLYISSTPTMGNIGALGFGFGWAPAILFDTDKYPYQMAYVTPVIDLNIKYNYDTLEEWIREQFNSEVNENQKTNINDVLMTLSSNQKELFDVEC